VAGSSLPAAHKVKGLHRQMKAFFHAHAGAFGRRALRRYRLRLEQRKCDYRGLHGLRVLPYLARNICGHL